MKAAVEQKDAAALQQQLELSSRDINCKNAFGDGWGESWSLLYECVCTDWFEGVKLLLRYGAKPTLRAVGDGMNLTPLEVAQEKGNTEMVRLLESVGRP